MPRERAVSKQELWSEIGKLTNKEDSAMYKIQNFLEELEGKRYKFIVCYSCSHLDQNNYLFEYRDEILQSLDGVFDIDLISKIMTTSQIKNFAILLMKAVLMHKK